jgi:hypothetical protein
MDADTHFCADYAGDDAGDADGNVARPRDTFPAGE